MTSPADLLAQTDHRPWPMPRRPWAMAQTWRNLLFAHWPVPANALMPHLPPGLSLDTFQDQAWVGVVPFHMSGVRFRWLPPLPFTSAFAEMNVRTYVILDEKPGVWFFSLDAASRLAVEGARLAFHLPYFNADMSVWTDGGSVHYASKRADRRAQAGEFRAVYRPTSPIYRSEPGTLDYWLTERYCLYAAASSRLYRCEIVHPPWPLQRAEADIQVNTVAQSRGIALPDQAPLLHYAERLDVLAWYVERVH